MATCTTENNRGLAFNADQEHRFESTDSVNMNNLKTPGFYYSNGASVTNKPGSLTSNYIFIWVLGISSGASVIQIVLTLGGEMYMRGMYSNTITSWRKISYT